MYRYISVMLLLGCFGRLSGAQDVISLDTGAVGTFLALKQLGSTGSVLHVVAHPDDEDGALLAYCARGLGVRTMLFSITRGEGGANLIAPYFFDELGALRTLEHLKSAGYYGNELFYSRAADYGFSKTLAEAFKQWDNGVPILADLVEVIRRERPTILLSRFRGDPRDGHGHHQMAGVVSRLAFDAAADPEQFPKQIGRGLKPWQVTKLYVGARSRWRSDDHQAWTIAIPTGEYDPLIGKSYAQVARFGLGFQRSQGISGHAGEPGPKTSYYRLARHAGVETLADREDSLFATIDTSLAGLIPASDDERFQSAKQTLASIDRGIQAMRSQWDPRESAINVQRLNQQLVALRSLEFLDAEKSKIPAYPHLRQQLSRTDRLFQKAIITTLGLQLDCWATGDDDQSINYATPEETVHLHVRLANPSKHSAVRIMDIRVTTPTGSHRVQPPPDEVAPSSVFETQLSLALAGCEPTRPYWSRASISRPFYEVSPAGQQMPMSPHPFTLEMSLLVNDSPIDMRAVVHIHQRHPEYGQVSYPLTVVPAMGVRFPLVSGVIPRGTTSYDVAVVVQNAVKGRAQGEVRLELPTGWSSTPASQTVLFDREDAVATYKFRVDLPDHVESQATTIQAVVEYRGKKYREGYQTITARDLSRMNLFREASHRVRIADVRVLGNPRVGYIMGSGDKVPEALAALDIHPRMLGATDLASGELTSYDVILVGVRAYAVRADVRKYNARLLEYVKQGGVLIIQYQTPEFDQNFGPYPYVMGRRPEEVSEEDAKVTILVPDHPLFIKPNRITSADFKGWFEQRGSKFWATWDDHYTALLECHDSGQPPQRGGMLWVRYGKGVYVYSAYAWYRQLPQGVPGAYRLFANMLSLPETLDAR